MAKLVHGRRGGYCQEHNALFHDMLAELGFTVDALGGRVIRMAPGRPAAMTHRLTLVHLPEGVFIADVGFGGQSPTAPLRLAPGLEQVTSHGTYRVIREGGLFEFQMQSGHAWSPMYRFNLERQARVDFEVANWFTSTHPDALFTRNLVASRVVGQTRTSVLNASVTTRSAQGTLQQRTLADAQDLRVRFESVGQRASLRSRSIAEAA